MYLQERFLELVPQLHQLYVGALSELPLWDDEIEVKERNQQKFLQKVLSM